MRVALLIFSSTSGWHELGEWGSGAPRKVRVFYKRKDPPAYPILSRKSSCFCTAFNESHPTFVQLSTKIILILISIEIILLFLSFPQKSSCFHRPLKNNIFVAAPQNSCLDTSGSIIALFVSETLPTFLWRRRSCWSRRGLGDSSSIFWNHDQPNHCSRFQVNACQPVSQLVNENRDAKNCSCSIVCLFLYSVFRTGKPPNFLWSVSIDIPGSRHAKSVNICTSSLFGPTN